jgi:hypothetical protein
MMFVKTKVISFPSTLKYHTVWSVHLKTISLILHSHTSRFWFWNKHPELLTSKLTHGVWYSNMYDWYPYFIFQLCPSISY